MKKHQHRPTPDVDVVEFNACVAPDNCNPSAHGWATLIEPCAKAACVHERRTNFNQSFRERGRWFPAHFGLPAVLINIDRSGERPHLTVVYGGYQGPIPGFILNGDQVEADEGTLDELSPDVWGWSPPPPEQQADSFMVDPAEYENL